MKRVRITDYGRGWFRDKRQAGRIAENYDPAYFDMGEIEESLEEGELRSLTLTKQR